jgi:hypothetical protein
MQLIRLAIAFTELLSLGFATIGARRTLSAVVGQLVQEIAQALHRRRQAASTAA